jgi:2-dehydro-3-deoxyphosphogluconate aldolase/(4S)-4-hydroxy-2-oxoglutarate aldolase
MLKFFPAEAAGGAKMLKNLSVPYASLGVKFCPTGGLNPDNMNDYLALPSVGCIGGSWLATKQQIAEQQWDTITNQVKAALTRALQAAKPGRSV